MERPTAPPSPPLSDGVITLRPWRAEDVPSLLTACDGDEELAYWLDRLPQPYTEEDGHGYVAYGERGRRDGPRGAGPRRRHTRRPAPRRLGAG